ncbi:hypothetical protein [Alkalibacterium thalassium]|uniref:Uncharacterized protein n=1 Tax=Alkalibacterium thalassium TaxID=426701 RepID=A0A1G8VNI1_9LACT|nr:hypothetical protein [Alkalibacterium thalassium]SDJ67628.1 hypothetical protein SAMN04488098_100242 [Alkalibacterium thalassium]
MIENNNGHLSPEDFIREMKNRCLSVGDLILLYEQYKRYNYMSKREVDEALEPEQSL